MTTNGHNRDPREIEADLDRTRAQLGDTLEALQRKLSPGELFDQMLSQFRSSGGSEFVSNFKQTVAQNPVPVALAGLGLAWLVMSGRSGSAHADALRTGKDIGNRMSGMASQAGSKTKAAAHQVRAGLDQARAGLERAASSGREHMHQLSDGAHQLSHSAREGIKRVSYGTRETVSRMSEMSRQGAVRAKSGFEYLLHEQPLVLGAIGVALGAALAAGLPRTHREDELMGETRDEVMERARETGKEQLEKAQRAAQAAKDTAMDEAQKVARATRDSAVDEAHKQGLGEPGRQDKTSSTG